MKTTGIILLVLLGVAVLAVVLVFFFGVFNTGDMRVVFEKCIVTDPVTQQDYFNQLKEQLENNTFTGLRIKDEPLGSPDQYVFYSYVIRLENNTHLDASALGITVSEVVKNNSSYEHYHDILQICDGAEYVVPAHHSLSVTVTVLSSREVLKELDPDYRKAVVTWYYEGVDSPPDDSRRKEISLD